MAMSAELAKPDSMGDLDQADEEEEEEAEDNMEQVEECEPRAEEDKEAEQDEAEERGSLLTEEQKEKSSPSIQLVAGPVQQPPVNSGSGGNIKVDIEQGPSPRSGDYDSLVNVFTLSLWQSVSVQRRRL